MKTHFPNALLVAALCACFSTLIPKVHAQHGLFREVYTGLTSAGSIEALTSDPNFPGNPSFTGTVSEFEAPDSFGDFYGQRLSGYIEAPQTGNYIFWIASDDQGQLFLSTTEDPQNKSLIAEVQGFTSPREWTKEATQRSAPVSLEAGKRYYVEALMDEGGGADHLAVRWQLPDGTIEEPIPNERLYIDLHPPQISGQPSNVAITEGQDATFSVKIVNRGPVSYQWFRNDIAIAGATNGFLTLPSVTLSDSGSRFQVRVYNDFATNGVASKFAFLTVSADTTPPRLVSAQTTGERDLVTATFSEPIDPSSGVAVGNYSISGGVQVLSATMDPLGRNIILRTTPLTTGSHYTLLVNNVKDRARQGNEVEPDSAADFTFGFSPLDPDLIYGKAESPGPSSRRTGLVISEIMYHPAPRADGRNVEFIELYNSQETIETIGGYKLQGSVDYTFPEGTFIPAHGYAVVAAAPVDMQIVQGLSKVYGPYTNDLPDSGTLQLLNSQGAVILDLAYESGGQWPAAADGAGASLVLARPSFGEADSRAWAASQFVGGSPGKAEVISPDSMRTIVINEFLAHTDLPQVDFVELYNYGNQVVDLSGVTITDDISTNKFVVPTGTRIAAGGFVVFDEIDLGFALSSGGERIIVRNSQKTRIIDCVKFGPQANGVSMGRFPDGNPAFHELTAATPNAQNSRPRIPAIVINEIMYNPISGNQDEEYLELFNRGTSPIDLQGWRVTDGISYTFLQSRVLNPGSYLVIAKNAALLRSNHVGVLTTANTVGDFNGNLSNSGERIALERPELLISTNGTQRITNLVSIIVDSVTYGTSGRWPHWADGGGSSIELINPNADNDEASNWGDSDETHKSSWVTIQRRGIMDNGSTNFLPTNPSKNLHILMMGPGEALLDNAQVFRDGSTNLVSNPGLENGLTSWIAGGTHDMSTLESGSGHDSLNALHIRASERGDTAANRIRVRLEDGLTNGTIVTLKADFRWLRGDPEVLLRLHGNYLEAAGRLLVPKNLGTPGAANSQLIANAGPAIAAVQHTPVLPVANQPVTVIARVDDPDRVALAALNYRVDPSTNYIRVPMLYSGAGYYSGVIPGQSNLTSVAFYIEALDALGMSARFPANAPETEGVIFFGETKPSGNFGTYRLWLTQKNIDRWARREKSSNEPLDATFVYNNERIVYNMGTLYSGSPFHWGGYDSPLGNSANYLMTFPDDDLFLGQNDFVLNLPSNMASDGTGVREQVFFWMADQMDQPFNHRRYHHLRINGQNRDTGSIYEDAQQPNSDFIKEWFPNGTGGDLHKIEDWFEYSDSYSFYNQDAELIAVWSTNLTTGLPELKQERYRWWFRKRAVQDSSHDYSELLRLVAAVNNPDEAQFVAATESLINIDEWMGAIALRHAAGDWDSFGYTRGKNMYAYKPPGGKWHLMHWDVAFSFGLGDPVDRNLFDSTHSNGTIDTITQRMFNTPAFRRAYYRALFNIVNGPFLSSRVNPIIDTKFNSLLANGVNVSSPESVKTWIASRRDYILTQLAGVSAGFTITSNNGNNYSTNRNTVLLTGAAPVNVSEIRVNGMNYPVTWTSATTWQIQVALRPQQNILKIEGYDLSGNLIQGATDTITVNVTGATEPIAGHVVINEIQYNPLTPGTEFVELYNSARNTSYDLSGYRLNGLSFVLPSGSVIAPGGFLVFVRDPVAFGNKYGFTIPLTGQFSGKLQNDGETLSLIQPGTGLGGTNDTIISSVRFSGTLPWPIAANGTDASLQLIDAAQDISRPANWGAVTCVATPGSANSVKEVLPAIPTLWLNELLANNISGITDNAGERDPWIELLNSGATSVSLNGLYLSDDPANPTKWAFPSGLSIAPGGRLLVWADGQPTQSTSGELHTSFRLNPQSGAVVLSSSVAGAYDVLSYEQLPSGQSFGRFPEGQGVMQSNFQKPTPGTLNDASVAPAKVFINEWMASNTRTIQDPDDADFDDWIELYNAGSTPADLGGYSLTDDLADPGKYTIPQGTTIPAHGYLFLWADNEHSTNGQLHAGFKLSASGDSIGLFAPDGSTVDSVTFGAQSEDVSSGRVTDGGTQIAALSEPSPGASNVGVDPNALHFTKLTTLNGTLTLEWNTTAGSSYTVQYKNALSDAAWSSLSTVTATGATSTASDAAALQHRFYRVLKQ